MEAPLDSWEERRGELTPAEAYRCWLFGEGLETGRAGEEALEVEAEQEGEVVIGEEEGEEPEEPEEPEFLQMARDG